MSISAMSYPLCLYKKLLLKGFSSSFKKFPTTFKIKKLTGAHLSCCGQSSDVPCQMLSSNVLLIAHMTVSQLLASADTARLYGM